jgi:C4-dicarboxylate-specific signal transduction histidine kinase
VKQRTEQLARANARLRAEMERRRQAEAELRRHESELAHVARVSMMGEMLAELAHEISQPLGAISSYAQASRRLLSGDLEEARESLIESVSQVTGQAERAAGIIRHLRRLLRKSSPASEWTDVNRLIRSAAEIVDSEASTAGVQMCLELSEPAPTVKVDRIQIEQVLINLLRNAVDALRDQPGPRRRITLRAEQLAHAMVQISVDDNGPGLTDEELEKIFDRFFSTKESGMGMGLPISRSIVENHGGQLWAERRPDGGTALYFTLPQMRQEESTGE